MRISGLNVVLDSGVRSLAIVLDEVPGIRLWTSFFRTTVWTNSSQLGNVLRIATRDTLKREAETQRDLDKAQSEAVAPVTWTRVLSYAKASSPKDTLKKFLSSRGTFFRMITAQISSLSVISRRVIPTIDNPDPSTRPQNLNGWKSEARVISASRVPAQDIGTELGFAEPLRRSQPLRGRPGRGMQRRHRAERPPPHHVTPQVPQAAMALLQVRP